MYNQNLCAHNSSANSDRRMEMRKSFVYLTVALLLGLLLSGCADSTNNGIVTASPKPAVTEPVIPIPTAVVTATPAPDLNMDRDESGSSTERSDSTDMGSSGSNSSGNGAMSTSSPNPTDNNR